MNVKQKKALLSFLFWARRNWGYAGSAKGTKLAMDGREFRCSRGKFDYWDQVFCFNLFIGQEMVRHADEGWIWGMNYYGTMIKTGKITPRAPAAETFMFLRAALLKCDVAAPYRGPKTCYDGDGGDWVYENDWEPWSSLECFSGSEKIFVKGILVYRGEYHGGIIKGK